MRVPILIFLLIVLFAAAVVAGIVATERAKRRRVAALAATAHRLGLQFSLIDLSGVQNATDTSLR